MYVEVTLEPGAQITYTPKEIEFAGVFRTAWDGESGQLGYPLYIEEHEELPEPETWIHHPSNSRWVQLKSSNPAKRYLVLTNVGLEPLVFDLMFR